MQLGERVRVREGSYYRSLYGPPILCIGLMGVVVRHEPGPHYWTKLNIIRFANGDEWACYEDELEPVP